MLCIIQAMLWAQPLAPGPAEVSETQSAPNLACTTTVPFNSITHWGEHQKIDARLKKLQNLFHLRMKTNLTQPQTALESLAMDIKRG